jgi:hypothetical protein
MRQRKFIVNREEEEISRGRGNEEEISLEEEFVQIYKYGMRRRS